MDEEEIEKMIEEENKVRNQLRRRKAAADLFRTPGIRLVTLKMLFIWERDEYLRKQKFIMSQDS